MKRGNRILSLVTMVSVGLFLFSVVAVGRQQIAEAHHLPPTSFHRDCSDSGNRLFGRCFNEGYFTGSEDYDTLAMSFPMPITYNYDGNCHGVPGVLDYWSFPNVACGSRKNADYTNQFIDLVGQSLQNYSNASGFDNARDTYGAEIGHYPPQYPDAGLWRRRGLASAMYVLTMLGGPDADATHWGHHEGNSCAGGLANLWDGCYAPAMNQRVVSARAKFADWAELVRQYDQLGLVDWNGHHAYPGNTPNSGGINFGTDVAWHKTGSGTKWNTVIFYDPDNTSQPLYSINRDCGNLVGDLKPLKLIDTSFSLAPLSQKPTLLGADGLEDVEAPITARFAGNGVNVQNLELEISTINGITVTRRYFIDKLAPGLPDVDLSSPAASVENIPSDGLTYAAEDRPLHGVTAGDRICVTITVSPATGNVNSSGTVSNGGPAVTSTPPACESIVNRPFVSFYSGDVSAGGNFINVGTDCREQGGIATFNKANGLGSGVQFAAQALGIITNFSSARLTNAPTGLTFANTPSLGEFGSPHCIPDYFADSATLVAGNPIAPVDTTQSGNFLYEPSGGTVTLSGFNLGVGQRLALYIKGDVLIDGNIGYASATWNSVAEIPSFHLYVSGNIYIKNTVSQLTGFFVAQPDSSRPNPTGQIVTCSNDSLVVFTDAELIGNCSTQLKVRGAFVADKVKLLRAANSLRNAQPGTEGSFAGSAGAEVFSLSPELYMTAPRDISGTTPRGYSFYTALPPIL